VSAGRDGAVRPPWIRRNRPLAALEGAWTRSAATYEVAARFLPPTVRTRPGGSISRGGRLRNDFEYRFHALRILHRAYTYQGIFVRGHSFLSGLERMAGTTGLEPAT